MPSFRMFTPLGIQNNVAVAAEYVKAVYPDIKKVLILDWCVLRSAQ